MGRMGNKVDPRCKAIYDQYKTCYDEWKKNSDWRSYYHEGRNEDCNELLQEFQICSKEQIARMTGYVPSGELMKIRDQVKERQKQEQEQKLEKNNTTADVSNSDDQNDDSAGK